MIWLVLGWLAWGGMGWAAETNAPPVRRSLLVLPFVNGSGDPQVNHWIDTFTGLMVRQFQTLSALKVVAEGRSQAELRRWPDQSPGRPWSEAGVRQIGERTLAQRVMWGSLCQTNGQWQAVAEVFTTATGRRSAPLIAASADWFDLRDQLTTLALKELGAAPTPEEEKRLRRRLTSSPKAFGCFSLGQHYQGRDVPRALDYFRQAVAADPHFALARLSLAATLYSAERITEARAAAEAAWRETSDPREAALGHAISGLCQAGEPEKAEAEVRQARELAPNDILVLQTHAQFLSLLGAHEGAVTCQRQAVDQDPENIENLALLGKLCVDAGRIEEARQTLRCAELLAENAPVSVDQLDTDHYLGDAYLKLGDLATASRHYGMMLAQARARGVGEGAAWYAKSQLEQIEQRLKAVPVPLSRPRDYTEAELQAGLRERLSEAELARVVNPLAITPAMRRWGQTLVAGADGEMARARRIFDLLCERPPQERGSARTAQEVFAAWSRPEACFNCQEYAKLYVALARSVGLAAYFVSVEKDCDGRIRGHACAAVFLAGQGWLVDPMFRWFGVLHRQYQLLDDLRLIALHCAQQAELSLDELACKLDPGAVVNHYNFAMRLGAADRYVEAGRELAWLREHAPDHWTRWSLEATVAGRQGDQAAMLAHLRKAIALNPDDGNLHLLLGGGLFRRHELAGARLALRAGLARPHNQKEAEEARHLLAAINEALGEAPASAVPGTPPSHRPDLNQARSYYRLAQASLTGGKTNGAEAAKLIRQAAELGLAEAQTRWGLILLHGAGVAKDETNAVHWFRQAAEQGEPAAMLSLFHASVNGVAGAPPLPQVLPWLRRAAEAGERTACLTLGLLYYEGKEVPRNYSDAIFWLLLADRTEPVATEFVANAKPPSPKTILKELELFATPEQFAAARARLAQFKKDHPAEGRR